MQINGERPDQVNLIEVIIPRGRDNGFLFKAEAVVSYEEFDSLCPVPSPPTREETWR